ncbi:hypothetical protein FHR29_003980 [Sphingobacterium sp. JUb56]|nr:hypothetical protein [Sphingobacterium sp. JUb56]
MVLLFLSSSSSRFFAEGLPDSLCHTYGNTVFLQYTDIICVAIVDASIRMVGQTVLWVHPMRYRHQECLYTGLSCWSAGKFVAQDLSGIGICNQAQVDTFVPDAYVGDVTHPYLFGMEGLPTLHKIGRLFETVVLLDCDGIPAFALYQNVILMQQPEESVPSQHNHRAAHFFVSMLRSLRPPMRWESFCISRTWTNTSSMRTEYSCSLPIYL